MAPHRTSPYPTTPQATTPQATTPHPTTPSGPAAEALTIEPGAGDAAALLAAHRFLTGERCPRGLARRITEAACALTGARFAALVPTCTDRATETFHTGSVAADGVGGQLLDLLIRTTGQGDDPAAAGFLSTQVQVRGAVHAHLHVHPARPVGVGEAFTAADRLRLEAFCAAAGTAVESSLVQVESARTRGWLNASGEIARALLADGDDEPVVEAVERLMVIGDADAASLLLPTGTGDLQIVIAAGLGAPETRGRVLDAARSPMANSLVAGRSVLAADITALASREFVNEHGFGPVLATPLIDAQGIRGAVALLRTAGSDPFESADLDLVGTFADQLTVALDLADTRVRAGLLTSLEERHRVARALHDSVMQRLFATGVGLQSLATLDLPAHVSTRLTRYVADLDETIDEIRERVFDLRAGLFDQPDG